MQQERIELAVAAALAIRGARRPGEVRRRCPPWLTTPKRAPGGGRKPRDPDGGPSSSVSVWITEREREQLQEEAEERGVSVSEVIRQDLTKAGTFYDPDKPRKR